MVGRGLKQLSVAEQVAEAKASPGRMVGRGLKHLARIQHLIQHDASPGRMVGRGLKRYLRFHNPSKYQASPGRMVGRGLKQPMLDSTTRSFPRIARPNGRARIETPRLECKLARYLAHRPAEWSGAD